MKDLLEIQDELRRVTNLSRELSNAIQMISKDIEALQEVKTEDDNYDYDDIRRMSEQISFKNHPIEQLQDNYICRLYIKMLVIIARLSENTDLLQMAFIQWIINKSDFEYSLEEIVCSCHEFNKEELNNVQECISEVYKQYMIIDAFMIVSINGGNNGKSLEFISSLCGLFGFNKKDIEVYVMISKIALSHSTQDLEMVQLEKILPYLDKVKHYIDNDLNEIILSKQREIVMKLADSEIAPKSNGGKEVWFEWIDWTMQGRYVKEGKVIARYKDRNYPKKWITIKVKRNGYLFIINDSGVHYAVISHKDDIAMRIRKWIRGENK